MKLFKFVESHYVSSNIELQTIGLKKDYSPWLDSQCKAAMQIRGAQHTLLKWFAIPVILFYWFLTVIGLKKDPQEANAIIETHKAFTLAQQQAAADAVKSQRLAQLHVGTGPQTLQAVPDAPAATANQSPVSTA